MNTATIKGWSVTSDQSGYLALELVGFQLQGNIYSDGLRRFEDGDSIRTSTIRAIEDYGTHKIVETSNTEYFIYPGDVDSEYEKQYPGAYERLKMKKGEEI